MSLVKCKECGKEVSNKAKTCPNCGAKVKAGFSIIKALGAIVFGLVAIAFFNSENSTNSGTGSSSAIAASSKELTATDVAFKSAQFGRVVTGKVANTTKKKLGYVQVEINLYDKNGSQVGSTLANVNNLEPGVTWNFEAPVLEDRAKSAKVAGITSF